MKKFKFLLSVLIILALAIQGSNVKAEDFDITNRGAVGDGTTDDTQVLLDTWQVICEGNSKNNPTLRFPSNKKFLLSALELSGPCKETITVKIDGRLLAPTDLSKFECHHDGNCDSWMKIKQTDGLIIEGYGTIDGQGSKWWNRDCHRDKSCPKAPTALSIHQSKHVNITDISFVNSQQMHLAIDSSTDVMVTNLTITAPGDSPNTDGIHISESQHVEITDSHIGTGDDCISIGPESSDLHISGITCGPGHGISIGSLGRAGDEDHVEDVHVHDITFKKSTNGARIKTVPGGHGYIRNVVFEHVTLDDVKNPIIIDQYYASKENRPQGQPALSISNITYNNFEGTSNTKLAVNFNCSDVVPCTDITVTDISILKTSEGDITEAHCSNTEGVSSGDVTPKIPCLSASQGTS